MAAGMGRIGRSRRKRFKQENVKSGTAADVAIKSGKILRRVA